MTFDTRSTEAESDFEYDLSASPHVMAGAFVGKEIVRRMTTTTFHNIIDGLLLCSGSALLWAAFS